MTWYLFMNLNPESTQQSLLYRLLVITGGGALLIAMGIDAIAVIGRYVRIPLLGSIEIVQLMVGISGALALIVATLHGRHAMVKIILKLLNERNAKVARRVNSIFAAMFFLALCLGSFWIAAELWGGFEESELWQIPYRPLRILVTASMACVATVFIYQAWRGKDL